jgi:hypothetical protein
LRKKGATGTRLFCGYNAAESAKDAAEFIFPSPLDLASLIDVESREIWGRVKRTWPEEGF